MKAHMNNVRREAEQLDLLAWLIGSYAAHAYHEPKKYPTRPRYIRADTENNKMSDDEMKRFMQKLSTDQKDVKKNGSDAGRTGNKI